MKRLFIFIMAVSMLIAADVFAAGIDELMPVLKQVKQSINATLSEIDKDLASAAKQLSVVDLKGEAARKILNDLRKFRPYVVNCSIIDANGLKITVEPQTHQKYEGADRAELPSVIRLLKDKKPVVSDVYYAAEGINAISIGYPIFSDKGELLGAVRMLIRHELFLKPMVEGKPCMIWIMQPNGLLMYDPDPGETGKNIFTDPLFKPFEDLVSFSKTVALSNSGAGSYDFYANGLQDKTLTRKMAVWDTVGLYGTEWRVIAVDIERTLEEKQLASAAQIKD
ncbi:MAG: cache domain-containing protein [Candidatus Omnitrophica bacterium]|nr:cache domain-containing protein [Candidatus Omnitrophota bacterium]